MKSLQQVDTALNAIRDKYYDLIDLTRRPISQALIYSVLMHVTVINASRLAELNEQREAVAYVAHEGLVGTLQRSSKDKQDYQDELKEALSENSDIDLGDFYLKTELIEGRSSQEAVDKASKRFSEIEQELIQELDGPLTVEKLHAINEQMGDYSKSNSYLSTILNDKKGNCQARERLSAALITRIFPNAEIKYQTVKRNGVMHTRTLVKIDGHWHNMDNPNYPMTEKDFEGTVIYDRNDTVRGFAGIKTEGEYRTPSVPIDPKKGYTKISISDNYIELPLPEGIEMNDIKDLADTPDQYSPENDAMRGQIGTQIDPRDAQAGQLDQRLDPGVEWEASFEFEVISDEEAVKRIEISDEWKQWLTPNKPIPKEIPILKEEEIDYRGIEGKEKSDTRTLHSWEVVLSRNIYGMFKEVVKLNDCDCLEIGRHSLFQNYSINHQVFYWGKGGVNQEGLKKLHQSRHLQELFYGWASPAIKNAYLSLDEKKRRKHLETMRHLKQYLENYDHKKERQYLEDLEELGNTDNFVIYSPDEYMAINKVGSYLVPDPELIKDYEIDRMDEIPARANRYAEAFIFRRIDGGMKLEDAKYWVEKGIQEMEALVDKPQVTF